ncbi:72 kDa inositol polyphosphate 5-phosphatase-like [Cimex lectularius]|uniref:Inositol polyphosphate-related phosphatase domain-containing protein n=1 Tax=Cimex lectularius TaxID=79782 RepID=A0A8I6RDU2_CIMLE|nr:72 kDa inositol polyphosphate 5-phosphatase-like [Cimex lectularius]
MRLLSTTLAFAAFTGVLSVKLTYSNSSLFHIRVVTWSVNKNNLPNDLSDLVGVNNWSQTPEADMIVIGLQNLGILANDKDEWIKALKAEASGYYTIDASVHKGNALVVLAKVTIPSNFSTTLVTRAVNLKMFSKVGAIITNFNLFNTQFTFVGLRLSEKADAQRRINQYEAVRKNIKENYDPDSDYVFWLGNFNFKIDLDSTNVKPLIEKKDWSTLLLHDQLKKAQKDKESFEDLTEQNINFRPTYKFKPSTNTYNWNVTPSWADRILFRSKKNSTLTPLKYELIEEYTKTEHKPVVGEFFVRLNCRSSCSNSRYPLSTDLSTSRPIL